MADNQGGGSNRGTAAMDEEQRREIASKGGQSEAAEECSLSKDRERAENSRRRRRPRTTPLFTARGARKIHASEPAPSTPMGRAGRKLHLRGACGRHPRWLGE